MTWEMISTAWLVFLAGWMFAPVLAGTYYLCCHWRDEMRMRHDESAAELKRRQIRKRMGL